MSATPPTSSAAQVVDTHLRDIPDFPKPGVVFKDFTPLFAEPGAFRTVVLDIASRYAGRVDAVVGIEARGFVFGAAVAYQLGVGFVPVRKAGKLPGDTVAESYDLEYGSAEIEVHSDAFHRHPRVVVLDDVLATGGTALAACQLVERAGATIVAFEAVLELGFLGGRDKLTAYQVHTILTT